MTKPVPLLVGFRLELGPLELSCVRPNEVGRLELSSSDGTCVNGKHRPMGLSSSRGVLWTGGFWTWPLGNPFSTYPFSRFSKDGFSMSRAGRPLELSLLLDDIVSVGEKREREGDERWICIKWCGMWKERRHMVRQESITEQQDTNDGKIPYDRICEGVETSKK